MIRPATSRAGRSRRPPRLRRGWCSQLLDQCRRRRRGPGLAATGRPWRVGIRHPDQADRVAAVLEVPIGPSRPRATTSVATITDRAQVALRRPAQRLRSSALLAFTDAYAAVFAMGLEGLTWLVSDGRGRDYAAYAITDDGRSVWTEGMDRYLVRED